MSYYFSTSGGGGGGFVNGTVAVVPLSSVKVVVGSAGVMGSLTNTYGGGGAGGTGTSASGASGGGFSGIFTGATPFLIAGGGGGGSPGADSGSPTAGGGGGLNGGGTGASGNGGSGGTQSAGGAASTATGCPTAPTAGSSLQGGNGGSGTNEGGGGGGGGFFGGGGGNCQSSTNGPGGGGSAFFGHANVTSGATTAGSNGAFNDVGGASGGSTDNQYVAGIGTGGGPNTGAGTPDVAAGAGMVVIQWTTVTLQTAKAWVGSISTDTANIPATTGGTNGSSSSNTASFNAAGGTSANSGAVVIVSVGNTIVFPAETFTVPASATNYTTVLDCKANGSSTVNSLSGTDGQTSNSLLIGSADNGKAIVCTYTNTLRNTFWDVTPNNGAIDGGSGTWDAGATLNWTQSTGMTNGAWAGGTNVATFQATGGAVNVSGTPSMGGLTFKSNGYTLSGGSLTGAASTNVLTADPGVSATVASVLAGGNAFSKGGAGTITLSGANTYTGATTVNGGTLILSTPNLTAYVGGPININNGATLQVTHTGSGFQEYDFPTQTFNFGASGGGTIAGSPGLNWVLKGPWTFNSTGGAKNTVSSSINLDNVSGKDITLNVALGSDPSTDLNIASALGNNGNSMVTKTGAGRATLGGANNYGGLTNVNAGTLIANNNTALGATGAGTSVANAATLALPGGITIGAEALTLSGAGVGSVGALSNIAGANTYGGAITLAAASTIGSTAGTLTLGSTVANGGFGLTLDGAGAITASGVISGTGSLTKTGSGTALLSAANTYGTTTTVSGGTLQLGVNSALPIASVVSVASVATLDVNGKTQAVASITNSGTLALGTAGNLTVGSLTSTGTLAMGSGSNLTLTSGTHSIGAITGSGTITVNAGATLTLTAALVNSGVNIVLAGGTLNLGVFTHSMGTLSVTAASTLDFASAGTAQITAATLTPTASLNVTNWTQGTDHFFATAVTGAPAKDTVNLSPLKNITMTGFANTQTAWLTTGSEISVLLPPTVTKAFSPTSIVTGASSTLTITLTNPNATPLTAAAFTDIYPTTPGALVNAATPAGVTTCTPATGSATVTATAGGASVALSNGTIPAGTCTVTVNVTSATAGSYVNTIAATPGTGSATSSGGSNAVAASATLTVTNPVPGTFWDGANTTANGTVDGGTSTWDATTSNWTQSSGTPNGPWAAGTSVATFAGTAGTVNVVGVQSIGGLTFSTDGYILNGTGTLTGAATGTLGSVLTSTVANATVGNILTGPNAFSKAGAGTITLTGVNTYTGVTTLSEGILIAGNNAALGSTGSGATTSGTNWPAVAGKATLALPGGIDLGNEAFTLRGVGTGPLGDEVGALLNMAGDNFHSGTIALSAKTAIRSNAGTLTLNGVLSGLGMLSKLGLGTVRLNGANTNSNLILVSAGTLIAGNNTALGTTAGSTTVTGGATLALPGGITIGAEALTLSGTGVGGVGALSNMAGTNTYGGAITLAAASTIGSTAGTLTLGGTMANGGFGLTLDGTGDITASGVISGGGTLTKTGTGTALLNAANSYTNITTVSGGTLRLGINNALPSTAVTVATGATLDVNGMTQSLPIITSAGTLALGTNGNLTLTTGASSIGAITGSGTITVGPGATLTLTAALANSGVNIVLAGGTLNLGVFTHSMGTLSLTQASTLDFASAGIAQLTAATLTPAFALNVTNWTQGTDHFFASAVTGNPARNTPNLSPLNNITLTGRSAVETAWLSSNEIVVLTLPPTISKVFSPTTVAPGVSSVLTITLSNPNALALTAAAFTDAYPGGLINASVPGGTTTCGSGTVTAAASGSSVALSGGTIPANSTCTVTVNVTSNTAGTYTNTIAAGALTSSGGSNAAAVSASLTVAGGTVTGIVFTDNGAGGGTANDGIRNGAEAPQSGVTVTLGNCSGTIYSSTLTSGTGSYTLAVPSSTANGAPLCVEQTNQSASMSTGASIGSMALPSGLAVTVGGTIYTRTTTPDRIAFAWNGTGHADLNFGDVALNTLVADGAKTGQPGNTLIYAHTFTAQTSGSVSFGIASAVASPAVTGWSEKIFADLGCTGSLQAGAAVLYPPAVSTTVVAGQQVCVIMHEFIPATAVNGYGNVVKVQADFTFTNAAPSLAASYQVTDVTTVGSSALDLKKQVRNVTQSGSFGVNNQAKSGETLEYLITYTNNAASPITSLTINDTTPSYTTFVSALDGTTPASLSACQKNTPANALPGGAAVACASGQTAGGTGAISFKFTGPLNPGATGNVLFRVVVD